MKKKTFKELLEAAPIGSFEDLRRKVREKIEEDLQNQSPFVIQFKNGEPLQRLPWIEHMFPDKVVVEWMDAYYQIGYSIDGKGIVSLGDVKKVEQEFSIVESEPKKPSKSFEESLKENGITMTKPSSKEDFSIEIMGLKEAEFDSDTGEIEAVLIEAGTNPLKKRHYPESTIMEAAPMFKGLKMYINHPTKNEEALRPERDLRDWASTIMESWYENGKAMAKISVHDEWLRERLKDPVARQHIGLSINTGGRVGYGRVQGQQMQIVEKIILERSNGPASVDWVTEAGARGRVSKLIRESKTNPKGRKTMELHEATFEDLQRENPKLVKDLRESIAKDIKESEENKKKETQLQESEKELERYRRKEKIQKQRETLQSWLKESKAPEIAKTRVVNDLCIDIFESESELREAFTKKMKSELEYINNFSGKGKITTGSGTKDASESSDLLESSQKEVESWMGIIESSEETKKEEK